MYSSSAVIPRDQMSACAVSSASHPYGRIVVVVVHHLGRHPARRADKGMGVNALVRAVHHARHAEVRQADVALAVHEDVARLDVARHQRAEKKTPVEQIGVVQVLQAEGGLLDDVGDDRLLEGTGERKRNVESLALLDPPGFPEILENAQQGSFGHERSHDPQRRVHVEAAVARQDIVAAAQTHGEDFLPDVVEIDGRVFELQHFHSHIAIIVLAVRFVNNGICAL